MARRIDLIDQFTELVVGADDPRRLAERTLEVVMSLLNGRSGAVFTCEGDDVALFASAGGAPLATRRVPVGPLGFVQLNVANDLGDSNLVGGSFLVHCTTAGGQVAAYASVIDATTADPRTILAR